jgi:hypothetical protein
VLAAQDCGSDGRIPKESNLIVLVGAKISAEFGEKSHSVTADFSRAKVSDDLGVSLIQVMQLTAECLNRNLRGSDTPIAILWKIPKGQEALLDGLPKEIKK